MKKKTNKSKKTDITKEGDKETVKCMSNFMQISNILDNKSAPSTPLPRTNPVDFCYYLQGFAEISQTKQPTLEQWAEIVRKLESVFDKVTPNYKKPVSYNSYPLPLTGAGFYNSNNQLAPINYKNNNNEIYVLVTKNPIFNISQNYKVMNENGQDKLKEYGIIIPSGTYYHYSHVIVDSNIPTNSSGLISYSEVSPSSDSLLVGPHSERGGMYNIGPNHTNIPFLLC